MRAAGLGFTVGLLASDDSSVKNKEREIKIRREEGELKLHYLTCTVVFHSHVLNILHTYIYTICTYVCMYVCITYVCMLYICMYACMYICMYVHMYVCMHV